MLYKDSPRIKIGIVLIYSNYNIATNTHSKTVIYNHLRMSGGVKVVIKDKEVNDGF